MAPRPGLRQRFGAMEVAGPVGASCWFDGEGRALGAWSRFGFGLIELGPTWTNAADSSTSFSRNDLARTLEITPGQQWVATDTLRSLTKSASRGRVQLMARLRPPTSASPSVLATQTAATLAELGGSFAAVSLDLADAADDCSQDE
ncbi:MAG: hypothetical protein FJ405_19805, partial [Verrucomicrobia bacterium]|nr:hypothetical protein [Verrucomicrobiota bacterium]